MNVMRVTNVEEAVALATHLQQEGKYDWFRGQVRAWAPSSSYERRLRDNPGAQVQHEARLNRFVAWAAEKPALRYLTEPENVNALFAVLQHYGFPTCYVDFTTDPGVAGFFASDCKTPPDTSGDAVIYCLDTKDFVQFYEMVSKVDSRPLRAEVVVADVSNLWRLQAQRGCFMFVNHAWYSIYDMDRIVFPWSGAPAFPSRQHIYPLHKSSLEQLLDQYFSSERMFEAHEAFKKMEHEARENGRPIMSIRVDSPRKFRLESFFDSLQPLAHWSHEVLEAWRATPIERFDSTVGRQVPVYLRDGDLAPDAAQQVLQAIGNALRWQPKLRQEAVEWSFTGLPSLVDDVHFANAVRDAWNGMRNLPYTNDDIASAISALVVLCGLKGCRSVEGGALHRAFAAWIPDVVEVEFGNQDGSSSRAYCSDSDLLAAIDPVWQLALRDQGLPSSRAALGHTHDPRLMFDFTRFAQIFARQVIPSQLAMGRSLVLFNPADLDAFGLP